MRNALNHNPLKINCIGNFNKVGINLFKNKFLMWSHKLHSFETEFCINIYIDINEDKNNTPPQNLYS